MHELIWTLVICLTPLSHRTARPLLMRTNGANKHSTWSTYDERFWRINIELLYQQVYSVS